MAPVPLPDELDALLNLEANFQAEGASDSQDASARAGYNDGRELGWTAGAGLSTELTFYHGAASALLTLAETYPSKVAAKAISTAEKLVTLCQREPIHRTGNDEAIDMEERSKEMRNLFRMAMAQAGLIVRYDRRPSRMADLSF